MQKIASFIVRRRKSVMALMLMIAVLCGILSTKVYINEDMTEYLPDSSSMKQGMDVMSEEFPETETTNSIRVMIQDLTDTQKQEVLLELESLEYADSVDYDNTENHNKGNQTLYTVNTVYDYGSTEEKALESQIADTVGEYTYILKNNNSSVDGIPVYIMIAALAILMAVLWIMCGSWIEPMLFLLTIGVAVIINSGTNYFLGSVSNITNMIAALLQLVLSMDYSIILMNRYRQELALNPNRTEAMSVALGHAFASISSSSITTIVGLLALVFMSFKIGMDLGIVLAKGVLISMICVFTVLPGLILMCTKLIQKTAKKVPHIPMGGLGRFSYRFRIPVAIAFVLLFAASFICKGNTQTAFTLTSDDPIADIFPNSNTIVLVYRNEDDDAVTQIADDLLENDDQIKAAVSYSTMLGKPYTVEQMTDSLAELSDDLDLKPELLQILYYDYYCHGDTVALTASEFLHFLSEDLLNNELIADELDSDLTDQIDLMMEFADAENLTKKKTVSELADTFGMDADLVEKLLLLYYTDHDGVNTGSMTLPVFANFVANEVANNPDYSSMFDAETLSMMDILLTFTDAAEMTTPRTYQGIANLLGMDADTARLLFIYYYAQQDSYDPGTMTMAEFVDLIQNKLAKDPTFSSYLDESMVSQVTMLGAFTDKAGIQAQKTPAELSHMLGIDQTMIEQLFMVAFPADVTDKTMSFAEFTGFLAEDILNNPTYASQFDDATKEQLIQMNQLVQASAAGTKLSAAQLAAMLGIDESMVQMIFNMASNSTGVSSMTLPAFTSFLCDNILTNENYAGYFDEGTKAKMIQMNQLIQTAVAGEQLNVAQLANILGMEESQVDVLLRTMNGEEADSEESCTATIVDFVAYLDSNGTPNMSQMNQLLQLAVSGQSLDAASMAQVLGMDEAVITQLYSIVPNGNPTVTEMSLPEFTDILVNQILTNEAYASQFDDTTKAKIQQMYSLVALAASNQQMTPAQLAQALGMDETMIIQLFVVYYTDISGCTMSAVQLVDFLVNNMSGQLDDNTLGQLRLIQSIMHGTVNNKAYTYREMSNLFGMDASMMKILYTFRNSLGDTSNWKISMQTVVHFLMNNKDQFASAMGGNTDQLSLLQNLIDGSVAGTSYPYSNLAALLGMDSTQLRQLYLLYQTEHGKTSSWGISLYQFVSFIQEDVLSNESYSNQMDADAADQLSTARTLMDAVLSGKKYDAAGLTELFGGLTDELDSNTMELMMMVYGSQKLYDPDWRMSIHQLFNHLNESILKDSRFESFIDDEVRSAIAENRSTIDDGIAQMEGANYSRLILSTTYSDESEETSDFIGNLIKLCDAKLNGDYYLIGSSVMNYEMENSFDSEMLMITLITALAIFAVVALTFKSLVIPLILVLIVQCGVYITVTTIGLQGYSIYYLALLIVQSILMGATIDYGILYTNYYLENRKVMPVKDALIAAYNGSIHTILTSGLILILVTGIVGNLFENPTIGQICKTISTGALSASLLILFMLPAILAVMDRFIVRIKKERK
ncbi:MAG: MMPL family transporter [Lachnospiraceae bacterium]|nr:MMPL family transporter [Lachnospiraceae bacterium]